MSTVTVFVSDGTNVLRQQPMGAAELEAIVDADIEKFNEYFQRELKNAPLISSEHAMLKTYLWWKTHPETVNASEESSAVRV